MFGYAVLTLAALGFVGLGARVPTPEWGAMITDGLQYFLTGQWWIGVFPGLGVLLAVTAASIIADRARDMLDPRGQYASAEPDAGAAREEPRSEARRALAAIFGASLIAFCLLRVLPGNPARLIVGPLATPDAVAQQEKAMGIGDPVWTQYWRYVKGFVTGDWGFAYSAGEPVRQQIGARLPGHARARVLRIPARDRARRAAGPALDLPPAAGRGRHGERAVLLRARHAAVLVRPDRAAPALPGVARLPGPRRAARRRAHPAARA